MCVCMYAITHKYIYTHICMIIYMYEYTRIYKYILMKYVLHIYSIAMHTCLCEI